MRPIFTRIFLLLVTLAAAATAQAQDKPLWAIKGVGELNGKRTNDTYKFVKFEDFGGDIGDLRKDASRHLPEYFGKLYGIHPSKFKVDMNDSKARFLSYTGTHANQSEGDVKVQADYEVSDGTHTYSARLVDEYLSFDENVDGTFDYTLYQLYAVQADPTVSPVYDDFTYTRSYRSKVVARAFVPGLAQIYKGQTVKGYSIIGAEAVLVGCSVYFDHRYRQYKKDYQNSPADGGYGQASSYRSKYRSWRNVRNISMVLAAGTYVYNIIDALHSRGPRQVVVKKKKATSTEVAMSPAVVYDPMTGYAPGAGLTVTF